jgi:hypothetical protein
MNGFHHVLEHRVENLARIFGVTIGEQLHRTLEVVEEHCDLLALPFEGALRGEDLVGEVLGSVRLGTGEAAGRIGGKRRTAGPAEFLARRDRVPQLGQVASSRAPQFSQKRAPASFSA